MHMIQQGRFSYRCRPVIALIPGIVAAVLLLDTAPALASTNLIVDSTVDAVDIDPTDGKCESDLNGCTLRAAITEANALAGTAGEVIITLPAGTYTLSLVGTGENANTIGDLDINCNVVIQGAGEGSTIISGGDIDRVFDIRRAIPAWHVELRDLTVTGGRLPDGAESWFGDGGGIRAWATVTLRNVTVVGNEASDGRDAIVEAGGTLIRDAETGGGGGGIFNTGTLHLIDSTVSNNSSGRGGDATIWFDTSDFPHPTSTAQNGGPGGGIGASVGSTTTLLRSHVTGNHTGVGGSDYTWGDHNPGSGGLGGGISADLSTLLELTETTVSGNWTGRGGARTVPASELGRCIEDPDDPWNFDCPSGIGGFGGGVHFRGGTLTLTDSTVADNWTGRSGIYCSVCIPGGPGEGGGIYAWDEPAVSIDRSTVSGNISGKTESGGYEDNGWGGGLDIGLYYTHPLSIINSTFSGNKADVAGGIHIVADPGATASIQDSTITGNHARRAGGLMWIGDSRGGELLEMGNSILAGNSASSDGPDCWTETDFLYGDITSLDYNFIGDLSDCTIADLLDHDTVGGNADLDPLADNGGPTLTHMPQSTSPAIDLGGNCQAVDQRGLARFTGTACDRGAVEAGVLAPTVITGAATEVTETSATLNASADPNGDSTIAAFDYGTSDGYGTSVDLGGIGSGHDPVPLTTNLTGLSCSSTYHLRARATNSGGTTNGPDRTFMTAACTGGPPDTLTLANLTIDGDPGEDLYEACTEITAGPNVLVTDSTTTVFRAGESVVLKDGVTIGTGSSFTVDLTKPVGCP